MRRMTPSNSAAASIEECHAISLAKEGRIMSSPLRFSTEIRCVTSSPHAYYLLIVWIISDLERVGRCNYELKPNGAET